MKRKVKKSRNYLVPVLRQRGGQGFHEKSKNRRQEKIDMIEEIENEKIENEDAINEELNSLSLYAENY